MNAYTSFVNSKRLLKQSDGVRIDPAAIHSMLFPFQKAQVAWACRKGRCAIFADTGLGKTFMQVEWARLMCGSTGRALIVAPLTVARQTVRESRKIGVDVQYARHQSELLGERIVITNYEMIEHFDPAEFQAVVLDESSILKSLDGKTRQRLTDMFVNTPYRLCCTATPAPNDHAELGNHSEFLGVMTRADMLATFFVHDDEGWRMKGHALEPFYRWLSSWAMSMRWPSDIGFDDDGFILPDLSIDPMWVHVERAPEGQLFFTGLGGIQERNKVRRSTVDARCCAAAEMVNGNDDQWIVWCGLNAESHMLASLIPDAVEVQGSDSPESKADRLEAFQDGAIRVLVTKPRIAGFGMNFQNAHRMVFVGLSDSWESYYQCIRRCWRFGQTEPVDVHIVLADMEREIYDNIMRKEAQAARLVDGLIRHVAEYERNELMEQTAPDGYETDTMDGDAFRLMLGDSSERLAELDDDSVGLSVFSPPFLSLYTYSPTERDVGNSATEGQFFAHFGFIIDHLMRATMPGRNCCVHVSQVPAMLVRDGYIGLKDFRGKTINAFEDHGWIYHGEVCIDKDPQAQAIRTKSKGLLFVQMKKDASWIRPALADYILVFRKPGDNPTPVHPDIDNEKWIQWARPIWYGIRESDTLNVAEGRDDDDERHICPLQLETIERCIRLWSNPGELVCDPFAGIGSTGYVALKHARRFVGCELKQSYYEAACKNIRRALASKAQHSLFDMAAATGAPAAP